MKKSNRKVLEDLVRKGVITDEELIDELVQDINEELEKSIEKSKKKIKENNKFSKLKFTKEYLDIKLRLYSERESVLRAAIPL